MIAEDVELAAAIDEERRGSALRSGRALLLTIPFGEWDTTQDAASTRGGYGLLVLRGLLVRQVGIGERLAAELLGPGDLLRPHEHDGEEATLPFAATWRALNPLRLAVLDRRWSLRMAPFPEVSIELAGSRGAALAAAGEHDGHLAIPAPGRAAVVPALGAR